VAGSFTTLTRVACNLASTGLGVALGASSPIQPVETKPGTPDSIGVGSSGVTGERFAPPVARARIRPARTWPITAGAGVIVTRDSPAMTAPTGAVVYHELLAEFLTHHQLR